MATQCGHSFQALHQEGHFAGAKIADLDADNRSQPVRWTVEAIEAPIFSASC